MRVIQKTVDAYLVHTHYLLLTRVLPAKRAQCQT